MGVQCFKRRPRQFPVSTATVAMVACVTIAIMTKPSHLATCTCGQLSVRMSSDPLRIIVCHCLACQRRTGTVFGAQATFLRSDAEIEGRGVTFVRKGDSGADVEFTFCPRCGSTVHIKVAGREDKIAIPVGAFADPTLPAPIYSVYENTMHRWVKLPLSIEHHPANPLLSHTSPAKSRP